MRLEAALPIAERCLAELMPHCERGEIDGSVRRRKPEPHDIEIVCIPKTIAYPDGLFDTQHTTDPGFIEAVDRWPAMKGRPTGKYTQRRLPEGINLDIFMVTPRSWALQFAIRTGSANYSHHVLAKAWVRAGYHSEGGILRRYGGNEVEIREERELYTLLGIPWREPELREWP